VGYLKLGIRQSRKLPFKFPTNEAFGFALGASSGITVLDIDTPDERVLRDALEKHGKTPIIVRSGSGNWQAWFRHAGEKRLVRPWGSALPIDVLGGGFVVAPPSVGARGPYKFIEGGLNDLGRLPTLQNLIFPHASSRPKGTLVREGQRNDALFKACLRLAPRCSSLDDLSALAIRHNAENMQPPLSDDEVFRSARSAWELTERKSNWAARPVVALLHSDVDDLSADELYLLAYVRRWHGARNDFGVPNRLAKKIKWSLPRLKRTRASLIKKQRIKLVAPESRKSAAIYKLGGGYDLIHPKEKKWVRSGTANRATGGYETVHLYKKHLFFFSLLL
jgi:hypothetical protein